jgi:hypothetical protein
MSAASGLYTCLYPSPITITQLDGGCMWSGKTEITRLGVSLLGCVLTVAAGLNSTRARHTLVLLMLILTAITVYDQSVIYQQYGPRKTMISMDELLFLCFPLISAILLGLFSRARSDKTDQGRT